MKNVNIQVELDFEVPIDSDVEKVTKAIYAFMAQYSHLLSFSKVFLEEADYGDQ